jgi:hypothetical protein
MQNKPAKGRLRRNITIDEADWGQLQHLSKQYDRSAPAQIRQLVKQYLREQAESQIKRTSEAAHFAPLWNNGPA